MVVFTCNYCGDSVNKPKADKHITIECKRKRYGCASLCCVDCLQDFDVRTFQSHTKCMTEEERYSAPGFVPKASSCKNERKQASWTETVSSLLEKPTLTKLQRSVLENISGCSNIPRKKTKFMNFMRSSYGYRNLDNHLLEVIFNLIESEFKANNVSSQTVAKNPVQEEKSSANASQTSESANVSETSENAHDNLPVENGTESPKMKKKRKSNENTSGDLAIENGTETPKVKKKKKDKESKVAEESSENTETREEPSNNIDGGESIVIGCADHQNEDEGFTNVKKSKKKKKTEKNVDVPMEIIDADANVKDAETEVQCASNDMSFHDDARIVAKSRGKKKHKNKDVISVDETVVDDVDQSSELVNPENTDPNCPVEENVERKPEKKKKKRKLDQVDAEDDVDSKRSRIETTENEVNTKFSWSNVVKTLLEKSKDHEMSVKRMTKKVVAEYQSFYSNNESFEDVAKKFNKKVKKLPFVIVSQDRIKLYVE